jgi:hypothetical protein
MEGAEEVAAGSAEVATAATELEVAEALAERVE